MLKEFPNATPAANKFKAIFETIYENPEVSKTMGQKYVEMIDRHNMPDIAEVATILSEYFLIQDTLEEPAEEESLSSFLHTLQQHNAEGSILSKALIVRYKSDWGDRNHSIISCKNLNVLDSAAFESINGKEACTCRRISHESLENLEELNTCLETISDCYRNFCLTRGRSPGSKYEN